MEGPQCAQIGADLTLHLQMIAHISVDDLVQRLGVHQTIFQLCKIDHGNLQAAF